MRIAAILLCACVLSPVALLGQGAAKSRHPDIFVVTIDTLRADHIHCYGYDDIETPALDALARDGVRFALAYTPSPITNTSHVSIFTGLLPSRHGVTDFAVALAAAHLTLAELLKKQGYHTGAFIGSVILDSKNFAPGLDRGFDFYDNFSPAPTSGPRWGRLERRGMDVAQHAESWLIAHASGPRFVWVHLYDPHDPYEPPAPYSQIYKDRMYDGEIAYADSVLANLIAYLQKHGWYDNAVILVVGDHGEGLGEHREETHGIFLYDSTLHVPLIVKAPAKMSAGRVVEAQVRTVDILPTVLDISHISPPAQIDGESLLPYFDHAHNPARTVFAETDYPLRFGWAPLRAVRADGLKFVEAPRSELYDLKSDPHELQSRYEPWDPSIQKFRTLLADLRSKTAPPAHSAGSIPQATIDELKALGYLGRADVGSSTNVPEPSLLPDPKDKIEEQNLLHKAMMASEGGRPEDARTALQKILEINPGSSIALGQLGDLELRAKDYDNAAAHLKRARELGLNDATTAFHEGEARGKAGDLAGAREALEASLKLNPTQFQARLLLGQVCLQAKDAKAALDQFQAALLIQSENVDAQLGLASAQIVSENFQQAAQELEQFSRSQPNNAKLFELLAKAYAGLGKKDEAARAEARAQGLRKKP